MTHFLVRLGTPNILLKDCKEISSKIGWFFAYMTVCKRDEQALLSAVGAQSCYVIAIRRSGLSCESSHRPHIQEETTMKHRLVEFVCLIVIGGELGKIMEAGLAAACNAVPLVLPQFGAMRCLLLIDGLCVNGYLRSFPQRLCFASYSCVLAAPVSLPQCSTAARIHGSVQIRCTYFCWRRACTRTKPTYLLSLVSCCRSPTVERRLE